MFHARAKGEVATFIRVVVVLYWVAGGFGGGGWWKYFIIMASTYVMVQSFAIRWSKLLE